jgi:hypothetical protein
MTCNIAREWEGEREERAPGHSENRNADVRASEGEGVGGAARRSRLKQFSPIEFSSHFTMMANGPSTLSC